MDNLYFKKLPSDEVPTVSGSDVVLVETASGNFMLVDSGGAKVLVERDKAFGVGAILFRANDISPASDVGGTWQKIAEGQTIIGASTTYPLNSEGGEEKHMQTGEEMAKHTHQIRFMNEGGNTGTNWGIPLTFTTEGITGDSGMDENGIQYTGNSQPFNIMQPYIAKNIWQRIA
ncbi:MAG: hypothetical protein K2L51_06725 [Clostridiales bacterium]|nr:hypothetical protein [Clostridiales bacterium]